MNEGDLSQDKERKRDRDRDQKEREKENDRKSGRAGRKRRETQTEQAWAHWRACMCHGNSENAPKNERECEKANTRSVVTVIFEC